jgi:hypothetical protein
MRPIGTLRRPACQVPMIRLRALGLYLDLNCDMEISWSGNEKRDSTLESLAIFKFRCEQEGEKPIFSS